LHDVIPLTPTSSASLGSLTTAEIDAAMGYAENEKSAATRQAYGHDWTDFADWCASRSAAPLPAHVGIIAAYLSHLAQSGLKASTIRAVLLGDRLCHSRLTGDSAARVIKRAAKAAGLDPAIFSGHSLRAGYVTSAVETDAPLLKVTEVTRHKSLDMLRVYSRRADLFRDHSGAAFL
jgi:site-specific recombinase XerD